MREHGCKSIVFSSSATVYGEPESVPLSEDVYKRQVMDYLENGCTVHKVN